jgi:hypothetical protein
MLPGPVISCHAKVSGLTLLWWLFRRKRFYYESFRTNDAVEENEIDLLMMSSPKFFAEPLVAAGKGALFAKEDMQDAYKLIPNTIVQWNLYSLKWLEK